MIIEIAGLPGAGKTTICKDLAHPVGGKGSVPLLALKPSRDFLHASCSLLRLALSARPFSLDRLKRAFNTAVLLRHYQPQAGVIVLDQGIAQKLWSILADADTYSPEHLHRTQEALAPFAPDHLVWLETPLPIAVERMRQRLHGNSRYDGLPADKVRHLLEQRAALLQTIAQGVRLRNGRALTVLDGTAEPQRNAAAIDLLIEVRH
ncbi:MAG: hypothetical protein JNM45_02325 [Rhizobiales bacterium]|nr:hypothetical protein [Hyphomicrobiales bacterium]